MKALRLSSITTPGRREREKAATRAALSEAALKLFLERGYGKVTVAEIAEAADTAVATLFAHFPAGKEALILDDSGEREAALTAAVRERPEGSSVLDALQEPHWTPASAAGSSGVRGSSACEASLTSKSRRRT
ncbi:TetR family transcriptional regulator [Lentzea atacamensis]|uniref:TetR family transcriptional regulator n=1 Tax=Lentzea atacamensis TaxID=531938 RepID=A0A316HT24_9PSEU|nr:TetR family transcriptional regulator [Lentzea atacamensis]